MDLGWCDLEADVTLTRGGRWRWDARLRGKPDDLGHVEQDRDDGGWSDTDDAARIAANDCAAAWVAAAERAFRRRCS
jgi:hypothetical protein